MKLRNKKTGNIIDLETIIHDAFKLHEVEIIKNIEANWEDVDSNNATNIPLIKDEKIRKAVRTWAELNNLNIVKLLVAPEYGSQFEGGYGFARITFSGITLELDYPKEYTIAELCGEEEECEN